MGKEIGGVRSGQVTRAGHLNLPEKKTASDKTLILTFQGRQVHIPNRLDERNTIKVPIPRFYRVLVKGYGQKHIHDLRNRKKSLIASIDRNIGPTSKQSLQNVVLLTSYLALFIACRLSLSCFFRS